MTDKQRAIQALAFASQSCSDALPALGHTHPDPHLILADIDALLALIYNIATKLALALKPAAPAYAAAIPLLDDLAHHPPALAHCTRLLHDDIHGAALAKDVRSRAKEIIDALRALLQTFINNAAAGPQLVGEEYLVRTATLHDLITNARSPSGIPKDNQAAVYRAWKSDRESLEDNLQEIATMIKDAQSDDQPDQLDDGWDDIGLAPSTKMDEHELARANNVHQLLRLTTLLHKRIFLDLLAHPSSAPVSAFDSLLVQSNLLLSTSDDLVAAFYSPHDIAYIRVQILELAKIATSIQTQLAVFLPVTDELANRLKALNVGNAPSSPAKKKADKKWFDTCVDQIVRLCSSATESPPE
ncbi:hypothetical protein OG21DRAFT_1502818 [Imleria badia]|nr:hypothetical protein OG21DRAFT_1502818 [Imleria badia]